jgi:hypothetical protein
VDDAGEALNGLFQLVAVFPVALDAGAELIVVSLEAPGSGHRQVRLARCEE